MKTTIDIPDELYRKVKAKSALEGRRIREVTIELFSRWLREKEGVESKEEATTEWLESWLSAADEALGDSPDGPSAREILLEDRKDENDGAGD